MKKLFVVMFLGVASIATAEPITVLFSNITATTDNAIKRSETKDHTVFCNYTNVGGSTTALYITLNGCVDDKCESLATHTFSATELTGRAAMFHVLDKPVPGVMGNISSITDTGTTYTWCKYWPYRIPNR